MDPIREHHSRGCHEVTAATSEYLESHGDLKQRLGDLSRAFHELADLIPHTLENVGSGHFFPFTEAEAELRASTALARMGYYRHGITALRWVLELGLLSVYWDRADQAQFHIRKWLESKDRTPSTKQILKGLQEVSNIATYSRRSAFHQEVNKLYGKLSDYIHTRGMLYSSFELNRGNTISFNPGAFEIWAELALSMGRLVTAVHLLKYPVGLQHTPISQKFGLNVPMGFLDPWQADALRCLFEPEDLALLQEISDADSDAIALAEEIVRRPEVTQEEMERQSLEEGRFTIRAQGFRSWLKMEQDDLKGHSADSDVVRRSRKRVDQLKAWATEKGWLEHGFRGPPQGSG